MLWMQNIVFSSVFFKKSIYIDVKLYIEFSLSFFLEQFIPRLPALQCRCLVRATRLIYHFQMPMCK